MCVDFTNLKKVCPKDDFPLARIDRIIDFTLGCEHFCFLDAYSGYHQVWMAKEDEPHTSPSPAPIASLGCHSCCGTRGHLHQARLECLRKTDREERRSLR
jgi:hypothetical protein